MLFNRVSISAAACLLISIEPSLSQPLPIVEPTSTPFDATNFVRDANEKLRRNLDAVSAKANYEFESIPETDLVARLRVALKYGTLGSQGSLLTSETSTPVVQSKLDAKTLQGFLDSTLHLIEEFEKDLTPKEVQEIVRDNAQSRFLLLNSLCSQTHRCANECSEQKLRALLQVDGRIDKAPRSLQAVQILNAAIEDQFWPSYLPRLAKIAERKKAPTVVAAYYTVVQDFYGPKVVAGQKKIELQMYDHLRLSGFSGSNDELKKTAYEILKKQPTCGYFHIHTTELLQRVLGTP